MSELIYKGQINLWTVVTIFMIITFLLVMPRAHEEAKRILDEKNIEERLRKYIEEQEEIIKSEAKKIKESYLDKASKIRSISSDKIKEAVEAVLKEVLRVE